ncbi:MBL fold metallo-hydrolase [Acinetobacter stercoris]|uniref:Metallo-beta-lactamase superfamily protein n=1 Tax=Acinetobacter stercoris TaxID=2126983 RepID=A0A2U3N2N3_9GAMM|nr:MBL fold metallo-hydrolase [Acinetobacter stercoris]SPL71950.1 Metallo-beta-lactamase superfamily protein [Acinetobacter stercoris]
MRKLFGLGFFITTIALTACNSDSDTSSLVEKNSNEKALDIKTYTSGSEGIFAVASTLISGEKDAILVDAQFQKKYAKQVVKLIQDSGKNLKYIYISHSDPDYYFGTDEILKAFPNAKVVSTAQTAYLISASKDDKLAVWKDDLKDDAPEKIIIPEALNQGYLELDGKRINVQMDPEDTAHSFLYIPSLKTVLGGISVSYGSHLWLADTHGAEGIDRWIKQINDIKALNPEKVIPGHYIESDFSAKPLDWIRGYLLDFKTAIQQYKTSADIVRYMDDKYKNLPDKDTLEMSAKVFSNEQEWKVATPYPVIGQKIRVDFDQLKFDLDFKDNKELTFTGAGGSVGPEVQETVQYTPVEVAKNVFMVYWHEKDDSNVVHVQDYNRNIVYTNISSKDAAFVNLKGTISGVKGGIHDPALQQPLNSPYPPIGRQLQVDYGELGFDLIFNADGKSMTFVSKKDPIVSETVQYTRREIAKNVFMVYWSEPKSKDNVVHIQDFNNNVIYTNIAQSNGEFLHLKGNFVWK